MGSRRFKPTFGQTTWDHMKGASAMKISVHSSLSHRCNSGSFGLRQGWLQTKPVLAIEEDAPKPYPCNRLEDLRRWIDGERCRNQTITAPRAGSRTMLRRGDRPTKEVTRTSGCRPDRGTAAAIPSLPTSEPLTLIQSVLTWPSRKEMCANSSLSTNSLTAPAVLLIFRTRTAETMTGMMT